MKQIKQSLGLKIFFGLAACSTAVALIIFLVLQMMMPRILYADLSRDYYEGVDRLLNDLKNTPPAELSPLLMEFSVRYGADVSLMTEAGEEIYAIHGSTDYSEENSMPDIGFSAMVISSDYSYEANGVQYFLVTSVSLQDAELLAHIFVRILPFILLLIIALSALIAYFYARKITKPIIALSETSQQLAALDLSWRSPIVRSDEIGVLANNLNAMAGHLEQALQELQAANQQLKADIARDQALEKQRSDFFAAVSHELKTPITIAKYDLEGMMNNIGRYKDRDKYLAHAWQVVEDMERLVQEIIAATRVSSGTIMLNRTETDMSAVVSRVCDDYEEMAHHKELAFQAEITPGIISWCDAGNMRKVVSNLLANAVNHSPPGGTVTVTLKENFLQVCNTGTSIPGEELDNIFLPFYRLDKSRSRHTGGSGLGLYFVKMILDLHGFAIAVELPDDAVCFTVKM